MTKEQAIEKIKWSIHINELTKDINGSNTSMNVEVLETVLSMLEEKEKIIDLMANEIAFNSEINSLEDINTLKIQIKQYFESKAKEVK
jgi:hypothetical protein|nr:MAG TPA_asm: hypothetical protein [Caudoviricetes sp.]